MLVEGISLVEEWKEEIVGAVGVVVGVREAEMRIRGMMGIRGGCRISAPRCWAGILGSRQRLPDLGSEQCVVMHDGQTVTIGQLEEDRGMLTSKGCEEAENKL